MNIKTKSKELNIRSNNYTRPKAAVQMVYTMLSPNCQKMFVGAIILKINNSKTIRLIGTDNVIKSKFAFCITGNMKFT